MAGRIPEPALRLCPGIGARSLLRFNDARFDVVRADSRPVNPVDAAALANAAWSHGGRSYSRVRI